MAQVDVTDTVQAQAARQPSARRTSVRVWGERTGVVLIVLGILGLIQPWVQDFFTNGFTVLLIGTLVFIVASHL